MKHYTLYEDLLSFIQGQKECTTSHILDLYVPKKCTKQGVYSVLRKLKKEGKILWVGRNVSSNLIWVYREIERLTETLPRTDLVFENFANGRTFRVKTLAELDDLWGQIFVSILATIDVPLDSALFYDLHNYTYIHKVPTVEWYIDFLYKKVPKICLLIGSQSPLDTLLAKEMKHISVHQIKKKWPHFLTVLGDYVIENHMAHKPWKEIDVIFETRSKKTAHEELLFLSQKKGNYKIVVERNKAKAEQIKRVFQKYFILPLS